MKKKLQGNIPTGIEAEVCKDIADRQALGIAKYGTTVADNPLSLKEWMEHAYQETLDKAVYLKRAMSQIDKIVANYQAAAVTAASLADWEKDVSADFEESRKRWIEFNAQDKKELAGNAKRQQKQKR